MYWSGIVTENEYIKFPSPLGVSYFQIVVKAATCTEEGTVSVPSRGILFPNALEVWMKNRRNEFPSPLGVSYFQIAVAMSSIIANAKNKVSVPSRGILFPNESFGWIPSEEK